MSVIIKGINKPTDARDCKFYENDPLGIRKPYCAIQSVCNGLDDCPLVEQKTGTWIRVECVDGDWWMCSHCRAEYVPDEMDEFPKYAKYCPNCGAGMDDPT